MVIHQYNNTFGIFQNLLPVGIIRRVPFVHHRLSVHVSHLTSSFDISRNGNFEHAANVLSLREGQDRQNRSTELKAAMNVLKVIRAKREKPLRDEKVITAWNG